MVSAFFCRRWPMMFSWFYEIHPQTMAKQKKQHHRACIHVTFRHRSLDAPHKKAPVGNVHRLGTGGKIRISVVNVTSQRYATHKHYLLENMKQKCDALWYHNQEYFQLFLRKDLSTHEFLDFFREDWNKFDFHNISGNLPLRLTQKHGLSKARVEKNQTQFRGESIS